MLIGLEVLAMSFTTTYLMAGLLVIPIVLLARWISVAGIISLLRMRRTFTHGAVRIITWAGLRGGLSVAMALSLPKPQRDVILAMTYIIVVFSIIIQGLTVEKLAKRILAGKFGKTESRV
jgi:CPA1 family monovalent cation:H+ antiporter